MRLKTTRAPFPSPWCWGTRVLHVSTCVVLSSFLLPLGVRLFTARIRSLWEGNVFSRVSLSVIHVWSYRLPRRSWLASGHLVFNWKAFLFILMFRKQRNIHFVWCTSLIKTSSQFDANYIRTFTNCEIDPLLIRLANNLRGHCSWCYVVHRHQWYNKTHSLIGTTYLAIIASIVLSHHVSL